LLELELEVYAWKWMAATRYTRVLSRQCCRYDAEVKGV